MTEIISKEELDEILKLIGNGQVGPGAATTTTMPGEVVTDGGLPGRGVGTPNARPRNIKIVKWPLGKQFSADQIRTLEMIHEVFARHVTATLSGRLRALVSLRVVSVEHMTYEEFIRSIPNPTTLGVTELTPQGGMSLIEIDPAITFAIIERLFGGPGEGVKMTRELSDIERGAMDGIFISMLTGLREAWSTIVDLRPRLTALETNPHFVQLVPPNDNVVLVTLDSRIGDIEGLINICLPMVTLEPIENRLSAQNWYAAPSAGDQEENRENLEIRLQNVKLPMVCEVGEVELPLVDISELEIGDVIKLPNNPVGSDMHLKIAGSKKFSCYPGQTEGGRLSVQIGDVLDLASDDFLWLMNKQSKDKVD